MRFAFSKAAYGVAWCAVAVVSLVICYLLNTVAIPPTIVDKISVSGLRSFSHVLEVLLTALLYVLVALILVKVRRKFDTKAGYISFALGYAFAALLFVFWHYLQSLGGATTLDDQVTLERIAIFLCPPSLMLMDLSPDLLAQVTAYALVMLLNGVCYALVLVPVAVIAGRV